MKRIVIRAEDKNRWEGRTPLTPEDSIELMEDCELYVEKSEIRCFSEEAYRLAGCGICEGYENADFVLGVKEIPEEKLLPKKVYLFFSHCIKGQKNGIKILKKIMEGKSTLIDYERIVDKNNKRLIGFGKYAGYAGTLDTLWLLEKQLMARGHITTPGRSKQAIQYKDLEQAKMELKAFGKEIKEQNKMKNNPAIIFGLFGYGNVSKGAEEVLSCLPINIIEPTQIKEVYENSDAYETYLFLCIFKIKDLLKHKKNSAFIKADYYNDPTDYTSNFEQYLKYMTVIINGLYWNMKSPSIVTWDMLQRLYTQKDMPNLAVIGDISCDIQGAIECNIKHTDLGNPFYYVDPIKRDVSGSKEGTEIAVLAVDNYPAALSLDASAYFSKCLKRYLKDIIKVDYKKPLDINGMPPEVRKAVIVYNGKLAPDYKYLETYF